MRLFPTYLDWLKIKRLNARTLCFQARGINYGKKAHAFNPLLSLEKKLTIEYQNMLFLDRGCRKQLSRFVFNAL